MILAFAIPIGVLLYWACWLLVAASFQEDSNVALVQRYLSAVFCILASGGLIYVTAFVGR